MLSENPAVEIIFGAGDKECALFVYMVKPLIIDIAAVYAIDAVR